MSTLVNLTIFPVQIIVLMDIKHPEWKELNNNLSKIFEVICGSSPGSAGPSLRVLNLTDLGKGQAPLGF